MFIEGKVRLICPNGTSVFYSPHQTVHRDLSVIIMQIFAKKAFGGVMLRYLDLFCGNGVRLLRFMMEVCPEGCAVGVDNSLPAIESAWINANHNKIEREKILFIHESVSDIDLSNMKLFHIIEVDPFGSSMSYIKLCLLALVDGGLLNLNFTNMKDITRSQSSWNSLRPPSHMVAPHEWAVRSVWTAVRSVVMAMGKRAVPVACWALPHGCRLMIQVHYQPEQTLTADSGLSPLYSDGRGHLVTLFPSTCAVNSVDIPAKNSSPIEKPSDEGASANSSGGMRSGLVLEIPMRSDTSLSVSLHLCDYPLSPLWSGLLISRDIISEALAVALATYLANEDTVGAATHCLRYSPAIHMLRCMLDQARVVCAAMDQGGTPESSTSQIHSAPYLWCVVDIRRLWSTCINDTYPHGPYCKGSAPSVEAVCGILQTGDNLPGRQIVAVPLHLAHGAIMTNASVVELVDAMLGAVAGRGQKRKRVAATAEVCTTIPSDAVVPVECGWRPTACMCHIPMPQIRSLANEYVGSSSVPDDDAKVYFLKYLRQLLSSPHSSQDRQAAIGSLLRCMYGVGNMSIHDMDCSNVRVEILLVLSDYCTQTSSGATSTDERVKVRMFHSMDCAMGYIEKKQHRIKQRHQRGVASLSGDQLADRGPCVGCDEIGVDDCESKVTGRWQNEGNLITTCAQPNRRARRAAAAAAAALARSIVNETDGVKCHGEKNECDSNEVITGVRIHYVVLFGYGDHSSPVKSLPISLRMTGNYRMYMGNTALSLCSLFILGVHVPRDLVELLLTWDGKNPTDFSCVPAGDGDTGTLLEAETGEDPIIEIHLESNCYVEFFSVDSPLGVARCKKSETDGHVIFWNVRIAVESRRSDKVPHILCARGRSCSLILSDCQVEESKAAEQIQPRSCTVTVVAAVSSARLVLQSTRIYGSCHTLRGAVYIGSKASCYAAHCHLSGMKESAVSVCSGGDAWLLHCKISACGKSGIYAKSAGAVRVVCCNVGHNGCGGLEVFCCSTGNVDCKLPWVALPTDMSHICVVVLNSQVCDNAGSGVLVCDSQCAIQQSTISRNHLANVAALNRSLVLLQGNTLSRSGKSGIYLNGVHTMGLSTGCANHSNKLHDVECSEQAVFSELG